MLFCLEVIVEGLRRMDEMIQWGKFEDRDLETWKQGSKWWSADK